MFGNSPFLGRLALREPGALARVFRGRAGNGAECRDRAGRSGRAHATSEAAGDGGAAHRQARAALAIAMADIAGRWDVEKVTAELTRFADACCQGALRFLLRRAAALRNMPERDGAALEEECGLTVLAMGKYGAHELNYSSDIDLVVFYDADSFPFAKRGDPRGAAVDIVRGLVKLLVGDHRRTAMSSAPICGFGPMPAPPRSRSRLDAAEDYYEAMGQNWERAAMIKARACAGDPETGTRSWPRSRPSSGGAIWISRPSRISIPSSGRSTPMSAMAKSRWRATTSSWGAAASARSNSSPRPSS